MSNVSEIVSAVRQAKIALGDLVVRLDLNRDSGTYSEATGKVTPNPIVLSIEIAITAFDFNEIDGSNVREDDLKGVVFDTDKTINTNDWLVYGGIVYKVKAVSNIMAGNTLVAIQVHLCK